MESISYDKFDKAMKAIPPTLRQINIGFRFITPEIAQQHLLIGGNPRRMRNSWWPEYARLMAKGQWGVTVDPIVLGPNGEIWNGQHRLKAIVYTGIGQWMLVATGCPESIKQTIDTHRRRISIEAISYLFDDGCEFATQRVLSVAVQVYDLPGTGNSTLSLWSAEEKAEALLQMGPLSQAVIKALGSTAGIVQIVKSSVVRVALSECGCDGQETEVPYDLYQFCRILRGDDIEHPARITAQRLREILIAQKGTVQQRVNMYLRAARCAIAFLNNEKLSRIYAPSRDPAPLPKYIKHPRDGVTDST